MERRCIEDVDSRVLSAVADAATRRGVHRPRARLSESCRRELLALRAGQRATRLGRTSSGGQRPLPPHGPARSAQVVPGALEQNRPRSRSAA